MKIHVQYNYDKHDEIGSVHTLSYYLNKGKTEEWLLNAIAERNKEVGWEMHKYIEVPAEIENLFRFMLGENEYKWYHDVEHVYQKLKDAEHDLDSMRDDCFHMSEYIEGVIKEVKELIPEDEE